MPHKAKKILWTLGKILVLCLALGIIVHSFQKKSDGNFRVFWFQINQLFTSYHLILLLVLAFFNRFFEIIKWQLLAQTIQKTSLWQASKQVLSSLSFAIITPNGLGEYAAKTVFFDKTYRKTIVFLNVVCNGVQLLVTVFFGILGLVVIQEVELLLLYLAMIIMLVAFVFWGKNFEVKGISLHKLIQKIKQIGQPIKLKLLLLAVLRFMLFSHQYLLIFYVFDVQVPYFLLLSAVFAMYLVSSSLPSFQFLEFLIRGGVGLYVFKTFGIADEVILLSSFLVWLLNVVMPILIGLLIVISLKIPKSL